MTRVTAITGGIGAGKSVVSRILRAMGYEVYDSDLEARRLMDTDPEIHRQLLLHIHPAAVVGSAVDRDVIAAEVFADPQKLARLNEIVHPKLVADFRRRLEARGSRHAFIETAILHQCPALHPHISDIWLVDAPAELRIERVMQRSAMPRAAVEARIRAQADLRASLPPLPVHTILNTPASPILPRLHHLLD